MNHIIAKILLIIIIICLVYYLYSISKSEAIYLKSTLNNREYLVQNIDDKEEATYMLSVIHDRIDILRNYLNQNIDRFPEFSSYIKQLYNRSKNVVLQESPPESNYTSYTVNKGDEIALCLRSKQTGKFHDINLVTYVVLHELAHVACPEIDHTDLFKKIFIFFLEIAVSIDIYKKVDYKIHPQEYCGIMISEDLLAHK